MDFLLGRGIQGNMFYSELRCIHNMILSKTNLIEIIARNSTDCKENFMFAIAYEEQRMSPSLPRPE